MNATAERILSELPAKIPAMVSASAPTPFPHSLGGFVEYGNLRAVRLYLSILKWDKLF